jgi:16S rRNA (adenine1518-N6/adenine1519-N6)-dimethyltransferase
VKQRRGDDGPRRPKALRAVNLEAKKSLGQHFLRDTSVLDRIVQASGLAGQETVIEIGAGLGDLTERLAAATAEVCAVEVDAELVEVLHRRFPNSRGVRIVQRDVLAASPGEILAEAGLAPPYVVVANLPYYITSAVLRHLLEATPPPVRQVLMIQKEVAERICATPGEHSLLSVSVQFYAEPEILFTVPPDAFYPPPKVESAVIRLRTRPGPAVEVDDPTRFFKLVAAGFRGRRKQLHNALPRGVWMAEGTADAVLARAGVNADRRAQTLSLEEWGRVYRAWREVEGGGRQQVAAARTGRLKPDSRPL